MNIIAVDIGNTNITVALFLDDAEENIIRVPGSDKQKLAKVFEDFWQRIPVLKTSKEKKRNGVIVASSVKPAWTDTVRQIVTENPGEQLLEIGIGKDISLPIDIAVDEPQSLGVDRVVMAAAAYDVVGDAVVVADFGTAVTIDLVNEEGVFMGGVIFPGFGISAASLKNGTAALPDITEVVQPAVPFGKNTAEAINNGLYYSAIAAMEVVVRKYAEELGKWPQTIVTGGDMEVIKNGCTFVESFVTDLTVKGIVLAYRKFMDKKSVKL